MSYDKIHVFTDADLDGAISYLTLCWYFEKKLNVTPTTESSFQAAFQTFIDTNKPENYSRIYVLDMAVTEHAKLLDRPNITLVDHHQESYNSNVTFQKARTLFKEEGSTCKLLYNKLKESFKKDIDQNKKLLISLGHDYDSYTLKYKDLSLGLNILFWNLQGNRTEKFAAKFYNGFEKFNEEDIKIIHFYKNKIDKHIQQTPVYYSDVNIGGKIVKVCSIFADFCINEIAQEIIDLTKSDIGIVVNLRTESVCFRRSRNCKINLGTIAEKIAEGGGHEAAAGGKLTSTFINFTKLLTNIYGQ